MTMNLTTIACNVVLGYKQPFHLISVHDANDSFRLTGVDHLCAGLWVLKLGLQTLTDCRILLILSIIESLQCYPGYAEFFEKMQKLENHRNWGPLRYIATFLGSKPPPIPIRQMSVKLYRKQRDNINHAGKKDEEAVENEDPESAPLLRSSHACVTTEKDGVITPCSVCTFANNTDNNNNNDISEAEWIRLPSDFNGDKGMACTINLPVVSQVEMNDTRFYDLHIGDGRGAVLSEVQYGRSHWFKVMAGGYVSMGGPEGSPSFRPPMSCK